MILTLGTSTAVAVVPPITALTVSPDGKYVVAGSQAGIQVFQWPSLALFASIPCEADHIHAIAFSPDGSHLAAAGGRPSEFGEFEVFTWPKQDRVAHNVDHDDVIYGLHWMSRSQFATASADTQVIRWSISDKGLKTDQLYRGHSRRVRSVVHLAEPKLLISAGVDQSLRVWKSNGEELVRILDHHTDVVHALAIRPGDHALPQIASCGRDRTVRLWQPTIGRLMRFCRLPAEPLALAWSHRGDLLAAACTDGAVHWIDPETVKVLGTKKLVEGWVNELVTAPSENEFVVGLPEGRLQRVVFARTSDESDR